MQVGERKLSERGREGGVDDGANIAAGEREVWYMGLV